MSQVLRRLTGAIHKSDCVVVFINQMRSRRHDLELAMEEPPSPAVRATQADGIEVADLDRALQHLSIEHREVLLLVGLEQMKYEEVSQALGIPVELTPEQAALPVKRMCPQSLLAFPRGWIRDRAIQNGIPGFHITCQECGAAVRVWWLTKDVNSPAQVFWHVYGQPTGTEDASGRG